MTPTTQHPTTPEPAVTPDEEAERQSDEYIRAYYANVAARTEATRSLTSDTQRLRRQDWEHRNPFAWIWIALLLWVFAVVAGNMIGCGNRELDRQVEAIERGTQ